MQPIRLNLRCSRVSCPCQCGYDLHILREAVNIAKQNDLKESAGQYLLNLALREAEVGNLTKAREQVTSALANKRDEPGSSRGAD
jgi:predicted negative regulator of RcsB-dependent stress response